MVMSSNNTSFDEAVAHLRLAKPTVAQDIQLQLYGAYKQATAGDITTECPSRFSAVSHAKWQAWNNLKGMSSAVAQNKYVEIVESVDSNFQPSQRPRASVKEYKNSQGTMIKDEAKTEDSTKQHRDLSSIPEKAATSSIGDITEIGPTRDGSEDSETLDSACSEDETTIDESFDKAVDHVTSTSVNVSQDNQLRLYGAFKQATAGDVVGERPSRFNLVNYAKWNAWNDMKGKTRTDARKEYIKLVKQLDDTFDPCSYDEGDDADAVGSSSGGLGIPDTESDGGSSEEDESVEGPNLDPSSPDHTKMFHQAADHISSCGLAVDQSDQLQLYSLFKQVTVGDVSGSCPSAFSVVKHQKFKAWEGLKGLKQQDAMKQYLDLVKSLDPNFVSAIQETPKVAIDSTKKKPQSATCSTKNSSVAKTVSNQEAKSSGGLVMLSLCVSAAGILGFLYTVIPPQGLFYLVLTMMGLASAGFIVAVNIQSDGLLASMTPETKKTLFETTFLHWCLDDTFTKMIIAKYQEIIPIFMCSDDDERAEVLSNMAPGTRKYFTTKGLLSTLPEPLQVLLVGSRVVEERRRKPTYEPPLERGPVKSVQRQSSRPDSSAELDAQNALRAQLFSKALRKTYMEVLSNPALPKILTVSTAGFCTASITQLVVSKHARRIVLDLVRRIMILVPGLGAAISALLLVWYKLTFGKKNRK